MHTSLGTLTYCTNIHPGESWEEHFAALKENLPEIKKRISPSRSFGIGLRPSHKASLDLQREGTLNDFRYWLSDEDCYVFTMNGFPYGEFHHTKIKDQVHAPDWITQDRVLYTLRLFDILFKLLPSEHAEGGISTSPLSYKPWHRVDQIPEIFNEATQNVVKVVEPLIDIYNTTGKVLHLDIEPEPDGLLESGSEFITWYNDYLLPAGINYLRKKNTHSRAEAEQALRRHVRLCYDVCHFAVGYENHEDVVHQLHKHEIQVGKIQISAALKALMPPQKENRKIVASAFSQFNESTYLHQVIALLQDGSLLRYPDLPEALKDVENLSAKEWRSHFHVPLFIKDYGALSSTQEDIMEVLSLQQKKSFTSHLEVETYTWEVLPDALKLPLTESIIREMEWVIHFINTVG